MNPAHRLAIAEARQPNGLRESTSLVAFSYRQAPTFDFEFSVFGGPASQETDLQPGERVAINTRIDYPTVWGAGLAYRSSDGRLTLSFEWDHVEYSSIFDSLDATSSGEFIPDGDEVHFGGEYAFLQSKPLFALRAGIWHDPDHQDQLSLSGIYSW